MLCRRYIGPRIGPSDRRPARSRHKATGSRDWGSPGRDVAEAADPLGVCRLPPWIEAWMYAGGGIVTS